MSYNTEYTDEPVCPHCGHKIEDAWEIDFEGQECAKIDCPECDKPIEVCKNMSITYNTHKN